MPESKSASVESWSANLGKWLPTKVNTAVSEMEGDPAVKKLIQNGEQPKDAESCSACMMYLLQILENPDVSEKDGITHVCNLVLKNTTFTHLNLSAANIGDQAIHYLSEAFKHMPHLKHVDLSNNNITDDGAIALIGFLKMNTTVTLKVDGNSIKKDRYESLYSFPAVMQSAKPDSIEPLIETKISDSQSPDSPMPDTFPQKDPVKQISVQVYALISLDKMNKELQILSARYHKSTNTGKTELGKKILPLTKQINEKKEELNELKAEISSFTSDNFSMINLADQVAKIGLKERGGVDVKPFQQATADNAMQFINDRIANINLAAKIINIHQEKEIDEGPKVENESESRYLEWVEKSSRWYEELYGMNEFIYAMQRVTDVADLEELRTIGHKKADDVEMILCDLVQESKFDENSKENENKKKIAQNNIKSINNTLYSNIEALYKSQKSRINNLNTICKRTSFPIRMAAQNFNIDPLMDPSKQEALILFYKSLNRDEVGFEAATNSYNQIYTNTNAELTALGNKKNLAITRVQLALSNLRNAYEARRGLYEASVARIFQLDSKLKLLDDAETEEGVNRIMLENLLPKLVEERSAFYVNGYVFNKVIDYALKKIKNFRAENRRGSQVTNIGQKQTSQRHAKKQPKNAAQARHEALVDANQKSREAQEKKRQAVVDAAKTPIKIPFSILCDKELFPEYDKAPPIYNYPSDWQSPDSTMLNLKHQGAKVASFARKLKIWPGDNMDGNLTPLGTSNEGDQSRLLNRNECIALINWMHYNKLLEADKREGAPDRDPVIAAIDIKCGAGTGNYQRHAQLKFVNTSYRVGVDGSHATFHIGIDPEAVEAIRKTLTDLGYNQGEPVIQ